MNDLDDNEDVRELLHGAVADVQPRQELPSILARTGPAAGGPRHRVPVPLAAAVLTAALVGGIVYVGHRTSSTPASPGPTTGRSVTEQVFYLGATANGPRLFSEADNLDRVTSSELQGAVNLAIAGHARDPDYRSGFPLGTSAEVMPNGTQVDVNLHGRALAGALGSTTSTGRMALQAVVFTVDRVMGDSTPVRFLVDGSPATRLLGVPLNGPVARGSRDSTLAPVQITSPVQGQHLARKFTVTGLAMAFEANVGWQLRQGNHVVRQGFATASKCCTLAPYTFTVTAPPGRYTLVVHDTNASGIADPNAVGTSQDSKEITVG
ncbi:MAG: GerMN domain-containing protein [Actinomycetota bacterium]|nr:GerMN domain-containing protein [Actinomycetota bacterium]MDQ6934000.1 GerMN domain-containing protein [Actinomycetota bacterium]